MAEEKYTWENLIFNPITDEAKNAVGKEVYYSNAPLNCVGYANENNKEFLGVLDSTSESNNPFYIRGNDYWACIIVKKEEPKPKYVPFESKEEFIEAFHYHDNANCSETEDILMNYGMWLKFKPTNTIYLATIMDKKGIQLSTHVSWEQLLNDFEFLDGSPCGKLVEENK